MHWAFTKFPQHDGENIKESVEHPSPSKFTVAKLRGWCLTLLSDAAEACPFSETGNIQASHHTLQYFLWPHLYTLFRPQLNHSIGYRLPDACDSIRAFDGSVSLSDLCGLFHQLTRSSFFPIIRIKSVSPPENPEGQLHGDDDLTTGSFKTFLKGSRFAIVAPELMPFIQGSWSATMITSKNHLCCHHQSYKLQACLFDWLWRHDQSMPSIQAEILLR